jgi:hypothetical protein
MAERRRGGAGVSIAQWRTPGAPGIAGVRPSGSDQQLGDLHGIEGGAFEQLVADNPEGE